MELEAWLRAEGWDVVWADDMADARRLQAQNQIRLGLLLVDRLNATLVSQIEAAIRSIPQLEWVAAVPSSVVDSPDFRELLLDAFLDFHVGPIQADILSQMLSDAHRRMVLRASLRNTPAGERDGDDLGLVGRSPAMSVLRRQIVKLAATGAPVLVDGERGSGKEAVARAIHQRSSRASWPFVMANCSTLAPTSAKMEIFGPDMARPPGNGGEPDSLLAAAYGGTLFLASVCDLPADAQARLLRLLQERTERRLGLAPAAAPDVRIIVSSQTDLAEAVAQGRFREDLFDRLDVLSITVPPLRDRKDDIPLLARHCLQRCIAERRTRVEGFGRQAIDAMLAHEWTGNVRELFNRVQRAVVMTDRRLISPADLELAVADKRADAEYLGLEAARMRAEREVIRVALARGGKNVSRAARELGVSRMTLYRLMAKHHIMSDSP